MKDFMKIFKHLLQEHEINIIIMVKLDIQAILIEAFIKSDEMYYKRYKSN